MAGTNVIELTAANWQQEVEQSDLPVMVDFWAVWCGWCRHLAPAVEHIADQFAGRVKVGKLDTDDNQAIAVQYGIDNLPQVLFFKGGAQPRERVVGAVPEQELVNILNRVLAS